MATATGAVVGVAQGGGSADASKGAAMASDKDSKEREDGGGGGGPTGVTNFEGTAKNDYGESKSNQKTWLHSGTQPKWKGGLRIVDSLALQIME